MVVDDRGDARDEARLHARDEVLFYQLGVSAVALPAEPVSPAFLVAALAVAGGIVLVYLPEANRV